MKEQEARREQQERENKERWAMSAKSTTVKPRHRPFWIRPMALSMIWQDQNSLM